MAEKTETKRTVRKKKTEPPRPIFDEEEIARIVIEQVDRAPKRMVKRGEKVNYHDVSHRWPESTVYVRRMGILNWMAQGLSKRRIIEKMTEQWTVTAQAGYEYIKDAVNYLKEIEEQTKPEWKQVIIEKLEAVAEDALAHGDRKAAIKAYEQISKITGIEDNRLTIGGDAPIKFDFGGGQ